MLETRVPAKGRKPAYWDERREVAPAWIGWLWEWPGRGKEGRGLLQPGLGFTQKQLSGIDSARKISILLLPIIVLVKYPQCFVEGKQAELEIMALYCFFYQFYETTCKRHLSHPDLCPKGFLWGLSKVLRHPGTFSSHVIRRTSFSSAASSSSLHIVGHRKDVTKF